jgi:hypothetical protein
MPYKHIAAHLKKTELACRLHYHQLSHGSNRRKQRTNSVGSSVSTAASPIMQHSMPSPIHENASLHAASPASYNYSPQSPHVQLPSASTFLPRCTSNSPPRTLNQPIPILPKPNTPRRALSDSAAPLRLDTGVVDHPITVASVDKDRLRHIYEAHRASFWSVIASEYGGSVSAHLLEEAWKQSLSHNAPPTPCISPDTQSTNSYQPYQAKPAQQLLTPVQENKTSATSISALLGIVCSN